jgi:hypothetical protein
MDALEPMDEMSAYFVASQHNEDRFIFPVMFGQKANLKTKCQK